MWQKTRNVDADVGPVISHERTERNAAVVNIRQQTLSIIVENEASTALLNYQLTISLTITDSSRWKRAPEGM